MEEKEARLLYLEAYRRLIQTLLKQVEVNNKINFAALSEEDLKRFLSVMETSKTASQLGGRTVATTNPIDDDLYAQMTASTDRLREELENQIKIVEKIIERQSRT
jgi:hypothetical protein